MNGALTAQSSSRSRRSDRLWNPAVLICNFFGDVAGVVKEKKENKISFCSFFLFFSFFFYRMSCVSLGFVLQTCFYLDWLEQNCLKKEEGEKGKIIRRLTTNCNLGFFGGCFGSKQTALALQGWDKLDRHLFRMLEWHQRSLETRFAPRLLLFWSYVGLLCPQWVFFL